MKFYLIFLCVVVYVSGCSFTGSGIATLDLKITDAPVKGAENVVIKFIGVEIKPKGGETISFAIDNGSIDLLKLPGSIADTLLEGVELEAGDYEWINLLVDVEPGKGLDGSYINILKDGKITLYELSIPGGAESGLKISHGFSVKGGSNIDFTIDFDVRKSIVDTGDEYELKPSLRLVNTKKAGHIGGTVSGNYLSATSCADKGVVYAYEGKNTSLTDINPLAGPVSSSVVGVGNNPELGSYYFEIGFLPLGNYTIAHTCDALLDDPESDDNITFNSSQNVSVTEANIVVKANFE
ncbi:MAG: DUF4382 domain-containing protein [Gammaproteobacteria bacterium]|nr:DUF4382 domain-containing protein [Gammaproteobacteria bacterium]